MHFLHPALVVAALLFASPLLAFPTTYYGHTHSFSKQWKGWKKCKLHETKVTVPVGDGPTKLPGPGSMKLKYILIGHGTQNYTCTDSTDYTSPVPNGAQADLYDVSSLACYAPAADLNKLPYFFLHGSDYVPKDKFHQIGVHYFHPDASTPIFDIEGRKEIFFVGKKLEGVPAPADADPGLAPDAFGAVDWLELGTKSDVVVNGKSLKSSGCKGIYRVQTAGGKPPATCKGRSAQFTIPYAAQYWVYK